MPYGRGPAQQGSLSAKMKYPRSPVASSAQLTVPDRVIRRVGQQADQFGGCDQTEQRSTSCHHRHPFDLEVIDQLGRLTHRGVRVHDRVPGSMTSRTRRRRISSGRRKATSQGVRWETTATIRLSTRDVEKCTSIVRDVAAHHDWATRVAHHRLADRAEK